MTTQNPGPAVTVTQNTSLQAAPIGATTGTPSIPASLASATTLAASQSLVNSPATAKRRQEAFQYTTGGAMIQAPLWSSFTPSVTTIVAGQQCRLAGGQLINCSTAGTIGASAPTFNGAALIADGSVVWSPTGRYSKLAAIGEVPTVTTSATPAGSTVYNIASGVADNPSAVAFSKFLWPTSGYLCMAGGYVAASPIVNNGSTTGLTGDALLAGYTTSNTVCEFITDDPAPSFNCVGAAGVNLHVWVGDPDASDMTLVEEGGINMPSANPQFYIITWASGRKLRRYRVVVQNPNGNSGFTQVNLNSQSVLYAAPLDGSQGLMITDSYGFTLSPGGGLTPTSILGDHSLLCAGIRWPNCVAAPGTGYVSGATTFGNTASAVQIPMLFQNNAFTLNPAYLTPTGFNPAVVVFGCGFNDVASGAGSIQVNALACFQGARKLWPTARIIVFGPQNGAHNSSAGALASEAAIQAAFVAWGDGNSAFYPVLNDPAGAWTTGTGHVGATTGTGNADFYVGSDATHPPLWGAEYLARRYAYFIDRDLASIGI